MTQSSMSVLTPGSEGFFFVLQANETGGTGSHQAGEVHVRKEQIGDFFPNLAAHGHETTDIPRRYFHAQRAEFGEVTFTRYGNRRVPEERLRKFPPAWRPDFDEGNLLVVVPAGEVGILFVLSPQGDIPTGFEAAWEAAKKKNYGRFKVPRAKKR